MYAFFVEGKNSYIFSKNSLTFLLTFISSNQSNKLTAYSKSSISASTTSKSLNPNLPELAKFLSCFNLSIAFIKCVDEPLLNLYDN